MSDPAVRIVFLGGLGEIGRNCLCLEVDDRILLVDCGLMFPDENMPGVDLVLPDFSYVRENADRVEGVFLTHAHEDHAGGLAFLLRDLELKIYGSALSLAMARNRIEESGLVDRATFVPVFDGERRSIGPFDCQFVPVTHSVPHGFATAFFTPAGTIVHTGDFKLDLTPVDGRHTNLALLGEIARANGGIRLLLSDSTNAERPGFTASESTVGEAMRMLVREHADRRLIVACFASHLHRIEQVAAAAIGGNRKIAFLGRSMIHNVAMARELGLLDVPAHAVIDIEEASRYAPGDLCIICTGSQGEPMSALSLMAAHEHKHVKVSVDDVVVLSAHAIPGNESNVSRVIDALHRAGAEVVHDGNAPVHVSGHASQEELKFVLSLLSPEFFVPIHGEYRHLVHHARLARVVGVPAEKVVVCEDGDVLTLGPAGLDVERRAVPAGYTYVDGIVGDVGHGVLRDRRTLAEEGVVVVIVTVNAQTGEVLNGPEIVTRGWVYAPEAEELIEEAKQAVLASLAEAASEGATDFETVRRHARKSLGRFIAERTRRRPIVIPVVMEADAVSAGASEYTIDLGGRTALVTGGGNGVGAEIVGAFVRAGASVWVNDIFEDRARAVADAVSGPGDARPVKADVTSPTKVLRMREETGPVDILVNNAGIPTSGFALKKFVESNPDDWEGDMRLNLGAVLHVTHAYVGDMVGRGWGRIVTIVSDAGRRGERMQVIYGSAKAGAMGFSRGLAAEVGSAGVTVNCVALGAMKTGPLAAAIEADPALEQRLARPYLVPRVGEPGDPTALVTLLCSDAASWITGQVYPVDGGYVPSL